MFLSYAAPDREIATSLAQDLRRNGIDVWWDAALTVGSSWADEIKSKLLYADVILVLVTPASVESHWVTYEWSTALAQSKSVVPVVVGGAFELLRGPLSRVQATPYEPGNDVSLLRLVQLLTALLERTEHAERPERRPRAVSEAQLSAGELKRIVEMTVRQVMGRVATTPQERIPEPANSLVFVITSFTPDMDPTFEAVENAAAAVGLEAKRVKDVPGDYRITDKILAMIRESKLIVADLTHERPNVYFELGFARGLGKRVITIVKDTATVHFDVQDWTYVKYADSRPLERELRTRFEYELDIGG